MKCNKMSVAVAGVLATCLTAAVTATALRGSGPEVTETAPVTSAGRAAELPQAEESQTPPAAPGEVTMAFAGDVHFEGSVASVASTPGGNLGGLTRVLQQADISMVNLETALTNVQTPASKELEVANNRYWFRTSPAALDVLDRSGVDVASMANNHAGDYGVAGLRESLRADQDSPVDIVGIGANVREAFTPYQRSVNGNEVAIFAADASKRESADNLWGTTNDQPGMAGARGAQPAGLLNAVRNANENNDIVAVYLHWGDESSEVESADQVRLAEQLSRAGADVIVGAHSHTLLGNGLLPNTRTPDGGRTYVSYGLGNFAWYHNRPAETGVLQLRFDGGRIVDESWAPGLIPAAGGAPSAVTGAAAAAARADFRANRGESGLQPVPAPSATGNAAGNASADPAASASAAGDLPAYTSSVQPITPALARRIQNSHDAARCPVGLSDLRYLQVSYVDFDGKAQQGELIVNAEHAADLRSVFRTLYDARWPIRQMRLVSDFGGNDDASMAANNSSGYNCRTVEGQSTWSTHAYGAAIDLNPVQNPYLTEGGILPPSGARFAEIGRDANDPAVKGAIRDGGVVVKAFESIGWTWGGRWSEADYQHFNA